MSTDFGTLSPGDLVRRSGSSIDPDLVLLAARVGGAL